MLRRMAGGNVHCVSREFRLFYLRRRWPELLDEGEIIQEFKALNGRLINFCYDTYYYRPITRMGLGRILHAELAYRACALSSHDTKCLEEGNLLPPMRSHIGP
ncbi:Phox/Bem1p [Gossypium australe]|uniref:Phox/Bem1p n=1 Tax=Gossypium australe TaxID=47621 RepID=A0A5B6X6V0_9ROSI|nr:Phox/Bem1p [Gossypium australe]